jgi:hypothetical protein
VAGPAGVAVSRWPAPPGDDRAGTQRAVLTAVVGWLRARRDEHTPGLYPYWLLSCLLVELRDAAAAGQLPDVDGQHRVVRRGSGS